MAAIEKDDLVAAFKAIRQVQRFAADEFQRQLGKCGPNSEFFGHLRSLMNGVRTIRRGSKMSKHGLLRV